MAKKKAEEKALNLDQILFNCRDYLRAARNSGSFSEMRNKDSDAHGVGSKRIPIRDYHARLFVNSAMTLADFILAVENNANTAHGYAM